MFRPAAFDVPDAREALAIVRDSPFGHLISVHGGAPEASGLPFLVVGDDLDGGVVRAHFARANGHWRLIADADDGDGVPVLVVFDVSDAYVSPAVYPSKAEHGRVVPTWNYEAVHVRGRARIHDDEAWLRTLVTDLTDDHEHRRAAERPEHERWAVTDAPPDYVDRQLRAIVGVEVVVDSVEAKRKLSQNRPEEDRAAVRDDLERSADPREVQVAASMWSLERRDP